MVDISDDIRPPLRPLIALAFAAALVVGVLVLSPAGLLVAGVLHCWERRR